MGVYVNEMIFGRALDGFRMGAGCQLNQPHSLRFGTFSLIHWPPGQGEEQEVELITSSQWFNQSCPHSEASMNTWKDRVQRASGLLNTKRSQEGNAPVMLEAHRAAKRGLNPVAASRSLLSHKKEFKSEDGPWLENGFSGILQLRMPWGTSALSCCFPSAEGLPRDSGN